jgi:hypothetical protein
MTRLIIALILSAGASASFAQSTHLVPADFPSIQAAIDAAADGDLVAVAPGTYVEQLVIAGKRIRLAGSGSTQTTISGAGSIGPVIWIMSGLDRTLVVEDLKIIAGHGNGVVGPGQSAEGGGIDVIGSTPTLRRLHFENNEGGSCLDQARGGGGAIRLAGAGPDLAGAAIIGCVFTGNTGGFPIYASSSALSDGGPGAILIDRAAAFIRGSVFTGNFGADSVGGLVGAGAGAITIDAASADVVIEDCAFRNNQGGGSLAEGFAAGAGALSGGSPRVSFSSFVDNIGGSVYSQGDGVFGGAGAISGHAPRIDSCHFLNNEGRGSVPEAGYPGAGAVDVTGDAVIRSSVLAGNTGGDGPYPFGYASGAGAIEGRGGWLEIVNCSLTGNTGGSSPSSWSAGGLVLHGGGAEILNSIFWQNLGQGSGVAPGSNEISGTGTVSVSDSCVSGNWPGSGNFSADPLFVAAALDDHHLQAASPCRDSGDAAHAALPAKDIDGEPRQLGPGVDIGADEYGFGLFPGSLEDLSLETRLNFVGDPRCSVITTTAGDWLDVRLYSASSAFAPATMYLVGTPRPSGTPALALQGWPACQIDPLDLIVLAPGPFAAATMPLGCGWKFLFPILTSQPGWTLRIQGLALDPGAGNGLCAFTEGRDLLFE